MNLITPFNVLFSMFQTNLQECKEDRKDYSFDTLCVLLINDQHGLLDEGKRVGKHQAHLLKGKGKMNYKERGHFYALVCR
jgi:hypothetical protein